MCVCVCLPRLHLYEKQLSRCMAMQTNDGRSSSNGCIRKMCVTLQDMHAPPPLHTLATNGQTQQWACFDKVAQLLSHVQSGRTANNDIRHLSTIPRGTGRTQHAPCRTRRQTPPTERNPAGMSVQHDDGCTTPPTLDFANGTHRNTAAHSGRRPTHHLCR